MASEEIFRELRTRIHRLRRKKLTVSLIESSLLYVAGFFVVALLTGLIDAYLIDSPWSRWILLAFVATALVTAFVLLVFPPLGRSLRILRAPTDVELARDIGRRFPEIKDRLATAIELFDDANSSASWYSESLVHEALKAVHDATARLDFSLAVSLSRLQRAAYISLTAVFIFAVTFALIGEPLRLAYARLMNPHRNVTEPAPFEYTVKPGNLEVLQGAAVSLSATITTIQSFSFPEHITVFMKAEGVDTYREETVRRDTSGAYTFTAENVRQSFRYYFQTDARTGGRRRTVRSEEFGVTVRRRPAVKNLQAEITYPAYSGLGSRVLDENTGDVTALKGSRVSLRIETTKNLAEARIVMDDSSSTPMELGTFSRSKAEGSWTLTRSGRYHIELRDDEAVVSDNPVEYQIVVTADEKPFVRISEPAQDMDLGENLTIHLTGDVQDDFGLTRLLLRYRRDKTSGLTPIDESYSSVDISFLLDRSTPSQSVYYVWNLEALGLHPEDEVAFFLEVFDNDAVSGPKSARSDIRRLRFPSLEEILAEVGKQQDAQIDKMEDISKSSDEMAKELDEIHRDMLKDKKLDWKEQEKLKQLSEKQEQIQQELRDMKDDLQKMAERMQQNDILSQETLEKYQELQKLMGELDNKEFNDAMKKLQDAMKNLDQNQMKDAVKQFKFDQESFKKNVERTLELFKRIKAEQLFDQLVRRAEELQRRQAEVNDLSQKAETAKEREALAGEQQAIKKSLDELQARTDELKALIQDIDKNESTAELDKANETMKEGSIQQRMDRSQSDISQGGQKSSSSKENRQEIGKSLQALRDQLERARKNHRQQQDKQVMNAMRKIVFDLLSVSQTQESVMTDSRQLNLASPNYRDVTQSQSDVFNSMSRVTENLIELSNRTFFVTSELGKTFGRALGNMSEAVKLLEERNSALSVGRQNTAMTAVNDAVKQLLQSMDKMQGGQSGTGMESLLEQLGQMAGKQGSINEGTMPLLGQGGNEGSLSQEQQQQLGRMLGQQRALKEALEGLQSQLQGQQDMKGRLGDMAGDMEEVIKDMERNQVNRKTIERQQKIFQRLLDASKSMHEKDFSEKRKGETGKEYFRRSPADLPANLTDRRNKLRQDFLKEKQQGFSRDYEELIQKYFEALGNLDLEEQK